MPDPPDVLKYFHEEPTLLEPVTPDTDPDARRREDRTDLSERPSVSFDELLDTPDAYRGYLAGTSRSDDTVGLTTLPPEAYAPPMMQAFGRAWWGHCTSDATVEALQPDAVRRVLQAPVRTEVLVTAEAPVAPERITAVAGTARRRALPALWRLLDAAHVVFFPEPAHDGSDWSLFSTTPMRERLVTAFRTHPCETVRRFVVPSRNARSESKFYFETWQLTESSLPDYIEEV